MEQLFQQKFQYCKS